MGSEALINKLGSVLVLTCLGLEAFFSRPLCYQATQHKKQDHPDYMHILNSGHWKLLRESTLLHLRAGEGEASVPLSNPMIWPRPARCRPLHRGRVPMNVDPLLKNENNQNKTNDYSHLQQAKAPRAP